MEDRAAEWRSRVLGVMEKVAEVVVVAIYIHVIFVKEMTYHSSGLLCMLAPRRRVQSRAQRGISSSMNQVVKQVDVSSCRYVVEQM
jgi:hypothetical protein